MHIFHESLYITPFLSVNVVKYVIHKVLYLCRKIKGKEHYLNLKTYNCTS